MTGRLAVEFIRGLQGDDSTYFKTIATVKHFAVHSGPEIDRHTFDAVIGDKDLYETYLPQFEVGIREAKAYSLMCAYNRYNGEACCTSGKLLDDVLRKDWAFSGFVVSDCDGIVDIYKNHKQVKTPAEAAVLAVKSGTDLECGKVYLNLKEAVERNLIAEEEIDVSVKRLFTARFKLGMFDPPDQVPYANIPYSVVDSKEHKALAVEAAQKSIVLLKNDNNTLPLKKDLKSLAVIGPNADQWLMHGLSYTTFEYNDLDIQNSYKTGDSVKLSVTIKNTGALRGDEVVQVYVKNVNPKAKGPLRSLAAFQRVTIEPGKSKKVSLTLFPDAFATYDQNGAKKIVPAQFEIAVGGGQPEVRMSGVTLPSLKAKVSLTGG